MNKKLQILLPLITLISYLSIIFYNQENIIHPNKRALQDYHHEWLNHPAQHSMSIIKDEEHKDILIVKRDLSTKLSKRSQGILNTLLASGLKKEALHDSGIILMFHGKNGRKEDLLPVAERYITAGFTCILVDLPAHGDSLKTETKYGGKLGVRALSVAKKYVDMSKQPIYFWGMSLGGRYAISSAQVEKGNFPSPKALILVSTFDKLSYVLKEKSTDLFGSFIGKTLYKGLSFSLKFFYNFNPEEIDSCSIAQNINIPVFMLHGKKDKLIGYKHGENLFNHFPNPDKALHLDEHGDHHNILVTNYPFYLKSILFLLKHQ